MIRVFPLRNQKDSVCLSFGEISLDFRVGKGFGKKIFKWAIKRSIDKGAHLVQLTTDKQRPDAIEFYKALGFRDSHMGMKLHL